MVIYMKVHKFIMKAISSLEWKMDLEDISMHKLGKFTKDNGEMICGMEKESIQYSPNK